MKKITFYGRDFSEIGEASFCEHDSRERVKVRVDDWHRELLETFLFTFQRTEDISLLFPKNTALFHKYVGVFRNRALKFEGEVYDVTLEIRCRFDGEEGAAEQAFFLAAMLRCLTGGELRFRKPEVTISFHQVMDVFLLFMFKDQLAKAAKKGMFRRYQRLEHNDSRPRGTIDIARHIRDNMGLKSGAIAYHCRELTGNNPVNRLIVAACRRLGERFPELCETHINREESLASMLDLLRAETGDAQTGAGHVVKENLRPITHPYFWEYEALRKICLKILRDERVSVFDADFFSEETDAIYCDITKLWEDYVKYQFQTLDLPDDVELSSQERKPFLEELFQNGEAIPDFVMKKNGKNMAILDAKFKRAWEDYRENYRFLQEDIFKCIRDKDLFEAQRTGVIFPTKNRAILETGRHPVFDLVGVPVPPVAEAGKNSSLDFAAWNQELEKGVRQILRNYLERIGCVPQGAEA